MITNWLTMSMKSGLLLLILVASFPDWVAAAEADDPSSERDPLTSESDFPDFDSDEPGLDDVLTIDEIQRTISVTINEAAQWIDSFFDDDRFIAEDASTKLRLAESVFLEHNERPEYKTRVSVSVDVPRTKRKLRVFLASEEDTDKTPDTLFNRVDTSDESSAAGVQYFAKRTKERNLSLTAGIKLDSVEAFIGPRYRRIFEFDDFNVRFTQRVRYFSSKGWEVPTRLDYERLLSERFFLRSTLEGRWREEDDGYRYEIRPSIIQQLADKKAVEYQWNTLFVTSPNHRLESSVVLARFRRNFKRKWLFYDIAPQVAVRNEEDFEPQLGITFQVEVVFGGKEFGWRRKKEPPKLDTKDPLKINGIQPSGPPDFPGMDQTPWLMTAQSTLLSDDELALWNPYAWPVNAATGAED